MSICDVSLCEELEGQDENTHQSEAEDQED